MKTILVDAGNQRIKLQVLGVDQSLVLSESSYENEQAQIFFSDLRSYEQPVRVLVSSVQGSCFKRELLQITKNWQIAVRFLSLQDVPNFRTHYTRPASLGIDRCLAMHGAMTKYKLPLIVVDAGTVVTVDRINQDAVHTGGMFFPGLGVLRNGINASADSLQQVHCQGEYEGAGITTHDCLCSGTLTGWVSAVSAIIDAMNFDGASVVVCGGEGERYLTTSDRDYQSDPGLVFTGMNSCLK